MTSSNQEGPSEKMPQLNLRDLCRNTLDEASSLQKTSAADIASDFVFEARTARAPLTTQASRPASNPLNRSAGHVDMMLERLFLDQFRVHVNSQLKSQFTT